MIKKTCLILYLFLFSLASSCSYLKNEKFILKEEIIRACVDKYMSITGEPLYEIIDRLYITSNKKYGFYSLGFTIGAMGVFAERDPHYNSVLDCSLNTNEEIEIEFLSDAFNVFIGPADYKSREELNHPEDTLESLFLNVGKEFVFIKSIKYKDYLNSEFKVRKKYEPKFYEGYD